MTKITDNTWQCDFGSGARLTVGLNSAHVTLAISGGNGGKQAHSIGLTPATLKELATRLYVLAGVYLREDEKPAA